MNEQLRFEYYYGVEADQFAFLMVPRFLIQDERFRDLSFEAIILYSLMLERMGLSRKNGWLDDLNRPFVFYSVESAMSDIRRSKPKSINVMKELQEIGLIERKKPGQGKPSLVYVKKFATEMDKPENSELSRGKEDELPEVKNLYFKKEKTFTSGSKKSELQEVNGIDRNYTESNHTEISNTEQNQKEVCCDSPVMSDEPDEDKTDYSIPIRLSWESSRTDGQDRKATYIKILRDQVGYEDLCREPPYCERIEIIDGMLNVIADVATTDPPEGMEWINKRAYSHEVVKSRLLKMDEKTLKYAFDRMDENTSKIRNMRAYLMTVLYNAKDEVELSLQNQVNHDMYGGGWQDKGIGTHLWTNGLQVKMTENMWTNGPQVKGGAYDFTCRSPSGAGPGVVRKECVGSG